MSKTFLLNIRTPEQRPFTGQVETVTVDTEELGRMQVLPRHASLTGTIIFSPVKVKLPEGEEDFLIRRGVIMVSNEYNATTILALSCEKSSEVSFKTVEEYLQLIEEKLQKHEDLTPYQLTHLQKEKIALQHTLKKIKSQT